MYTIPKTKTNKTINKTQYVLDTTICEKKQKTKQNKKQNKTKPKKQKNKTKQKPTQLT